MGLVIFSTITSEPVDSMPMGEMANAVTNPNTKIRVRIDTAQKAKYAAPQSTNRLTLDEIVANRSISRMTLVVLTADKPYPPPTTPGIPANMNTVTRQAQDVSQKQVAQLVPGAEHITKTNSGHDIMLENPVLVSDAIVDVIAAVRDGRTTMN